MRRIHRCCVGPGELGKWPQAGSIAASARIRERSGWVGTTALAMGGSNQMIFLITALFVGQGDILGQGSAAVPLLIVGLLLGWAAAPAWTELVLMWPNRVGGIAAACAEAFRPYSPVLSALTGTCYWWGWVPTCGLTALLLRRRHPAVVPAGPSGRGGRDRDRCCSSPASICAASRWVTRLAIPIAARLRGARFPFVAHPDSERRRRLAAGDDFHADVAVPRLVRRSDLGDGRALSDRLRRAGVRGRRLPRRRDDRPQPQRAARHARERRDGRHLLHRAAGRVARRARARAARQRPRARARADVRAAARQLRQGGRDLVHHAQHVPRHDAAAGRRGAHAVPA